MIWAQRSTRPSRTLKDCCILSFSVLRAGCAQVEIVIKAQVETAKVTPDTYFADFRAMEQAPKQTTWLRSLRNRAMEAFAELEFPTTRQEAWRFTNVGPLARIPFRLALPIDHVTSFEEKLERYSIAGAAARLVFVNGYFNPRLSSLANLPEGVNATSLQQALTAADAILEQRLATYADAVGEPFVALNTAFLRDGCFVRVAQGVVLERPIQVVYLRIEGSQNTVSHPRTLVVAERGAQAQVIESHVGLADEPYFTNAVTELVVGEDASVEHLKIQEESDRAFHVANVVAHQKRSSRLLSHSISLGAELARHDIRSIMAGEGAECTLNGLYEVRGRQHVDHHTTLDHAMPHCGSREYYRGILDGRSSAVFNGAIIVRKDAQKTDAIQSNKNLLLSEEATINTKPELQILADDVRCTHGATVGQLDPDAVFYLRARGIGLEAAKHLLTRAFVNDVIARIRCAPARERLEATLLSRLSAGWRPEEVL
jgi:Fe-S cluster assembly protein SufD